ncbi:hypothetical protein ZIOFF_068526 [Zingiber officinale]|uniref:Myb-like domain-containing protein n=1 Tax=Zingiber officinale TaxID=94328 RepID=A0A8J5EV19_ZINOF|nr:hypothetical protein ZIOFF_068526 [Zingiber officinale]
MEANLNNGFYQESRSSQFNYPRMVCFQSSAIDSSTGMAPGDVPTLAGNTNMEMMPWFRHVSSTPEYWSPDEVETLNKGLINFASESRIQKFTKIAAMLPQKTIRDVALRCQWMILANSNHVYPPPMFYASFGVGELKSLLEKNEKCLKEIARNLEGGMMQDNISLFHCTRNNIATLENRITILPRGMNQLPGSLRQIPSMPVTVNDGLLSSLAPLDEHINQKD